MTTTRVIPGVETLVPISTEIFQVADQNIFAFSHITITRPELELTLQIDGRSITKTVSDWHKMALEQEE